MNPVQWRWKTSTILLAVLLAGPVAALGQDASPGAVIHTEIRDAQGRVLQEVYRKDDNGDGAVDITETFTYGYTNDLLALKFATFVRERSHEVIRTEVTTFEYDDSGRRISESNLKNDSPAAGGKLQRVDQKFTFDGDLIVGKTTLNDAGDDGSIELKETTQFEYDDDRTLRRETIDFDDRNDGQIDRRAVAEFEHDDQWLVRKELRWYRLADGVLREDPASHTVTEYVRTEDGSLELETAQTISGDAAAPVRQSSTIWAHETQVEEAE